MSPSRSNTIDLPSALTSDDIQLPDVVVKLRVRVGLSGSPSCMGSRGPPPRWARRAAGSSMSAQKRVIERAISCLDTEPGPRGLQRRYGDTNVGKLHAAGHACNA